MNVDPLQLGETMRLLMVVCFLSGICCWESGRVLAALIVYVLGWRIRRRRWARWMIERARS